MKKHDEDFEPSSSREARTYQEYYELKAEEERMRHQRNTAIVIACIIAVTALLIIYLTR